MEGRNSGADDASTTEVKELYLTPEERYEVYAVKASERPHFLETYNESSTSVKTADNDENFPPPLTDGCDIPRWRAEGMAQVDSLLQVALNVGLGCNLLRRESQLPLPFSPKLNYKEDQRFRWEVLQEKLMYHQPVTETVERISCSKAASLIMPSNAEMVENNSTGGIPRRKVFSKWETDNYPVIIEGCTEDWNLFVWDYERLVARYGDIRWRFSDIHGAVMTLGTYAKYAATEGLVDDSPLAVYDSEFGDSDSPMHVLATDYTTPSCFSDDLFALATEKSSSTHMDAGNTNASFERINETETKSIGNSALFDNSIISIAEFMPNPPSDSESNSSDEDDTRPPWRWILMGPPRSGTGLHIDPLWTNAWVTLLEGAKRWILIPPHLQSQLPEGSGLREPQIPSVIWFRDYYDDVIRLDGVVEILQRQGETVFVPNGWPHLVLNLERTVAVTHNYASEFGPFERMWEQVLQDEPEFAQRWYRGLCTHRPDLASRIQMPKET